MCAINSQLPARVNSQLLAAVAVSYRAVKNRWMPTRKTRELKFTDAERLAIGERLEAAARLMKMNEKTLAAAMDVSKQQVLKMFKGMGSLPAFALACRQCKASMD